MRSREVSQNKDCNALFHGRTNGRDDRVRHDERGAPGVEKWRSRYLSSSISPVAPLTWLMTDRVCTTGSVRGTHVTQIKQKNSSTICTITRGLSYTTQTAQHAEKTHRRRNILMINLTV